MQPPLNDRQNTIVTLVRSAGRVTVEELAARFEVTPQTIRRDLNELCDLRVLSRTHGGAVIASSVENLSYEARRFIAAAEKREIAIAAAALIPNQCSLFINIGTTTEEVATALKNHQNLLVITNNLNVAMALYRHPTIEVIVAGGLVRGSDGAVIGRGSIIGAHALVTKGTRIPPGSLVMGTPAKVVRALSPEEIAEIRTWADHYIALAPLHKMHFEKSAPVVQSF